MSKRTLRYHCRPAWGNCASLTRWEKVCRGWSTPPFAVQRKALKSLTLPLTATVTSECKYLWKEITPARKKELWSFGRDQWCQRELSPEQAITQLLKVFILGTLNQESKTQTLLQKEILVSSSERAK